MRQLSYIRIFWYHIYIYIYIYAHHVVVWAAPHEAALDALHGRQPDGRLREREREREGEGDRKRGGEGEGGRGREGGSVCVWGGRKWARKKKLVRDRGGESGALEGQRERERDRRGVGER
jgi:hypothetical protein